MNRVPFRPLVSVIVPAYNASEFIRDALDSALAQTLREIEVLVVDDGSEDRTSAIVAEIAQKDARVRLISQPNSGVAAARNRAIRESTASYIAPLDADDTWSATKLEEQVARMEKGGGAMGMVYSWWAGMDELGRRTGVTQTWDVENAVYGVLLFANFIGNASVPLFRRAVLDRVGLYDESFRTRGGEGCEDWDLSLRVAEQGLVGLAPGFHTGYREGTHSMSKHCERMARSFDLVWDSVRERNGNIPSRLHRWSRGTFYLYLASQAYEGNHHGEAKRWLLRAAAVDPVGMIGRWYWMRLWRSMLGRDNPLGDPSGDHRAALSLAALASPSQLEPKPGAWWKIYAQIRSRRASWAEEWSRSYLRERALDAELEAFPSPQHQNAA